MALIILYQTALYIITIYFRSPSHETLINTWKYLRCFVLGQWNQDETETWTRTNWNISDSANETQNADGSSTNIKVEL